MPEQPGYFDQLEAHVAKVDGMTLESTHNGASWFVTVRRADGMSATGQHPDKDRAAKQAARLYNIRRSR